MTPFDLAWALLAKAQTTYGPGQAPPRTRQTELGEYHPRFPSSHGEMTLVRRLSPERMEQVFQEGVKPLPQSAHNTGFEEQYRNSRGIKEIPTDEPGTWWTLPYSYDMKRVATQRGYESDPFIGFRGNPRQLDFMFRGRSQSPEGLNEAMVLSEIPPEKLVRISPPNSSYHQTPQSIARYYGMLEGRNKNLLDEGRWADTVPYAEAANA